MDKVVMLLSADWFFPHWETIGISDDRNRKDCLRSSCREIVGYLMQQSNDYYHISFSPQRTETVKSMFHEALQKCGIGEDSISRLTGLIALRPTASSGRKGFTWTFGMISKLLSSEHEIDTTMLDPSLKKTIVETSAKYLTNKTDFEKECLRATSDWDRYLKGLTPDLPCSLAYYVSQSLLPELTFERIWTDLSKRLTSEQQNEVQKCYRQIAETSMRIDTTQWPIPWGKQN